MICRRTPVIKILGLRGATFIMCSKKCRDEMYKKQPLGATVRKMIKVPDSKRKEFGICSWCYKDL